MQMFTGVVIHALGAVEGHEKHAKGVERGDEHAREHAKVRIARADPM